MKKRIAVIVGVSALALAGVASASVTFDPTCSLTPSLSQGACGFVGKGDVQVPFGWNNATAQSEAKNVSFAYNATSTYDVEIQFDTGGIHNTTHHTVTQSKSTMVNAAVASDPRKTGQYTGWFLTSLGTTTTSGDAIPMVGDPCPNGDLGTCTVTAVTPTGSTGGLYVSDVVLVLGPIQIG